MKRLLYNLFTMQSSGSYDLPLKGDEHITDTGYETPMGSSSVYIKKVFDKALAREAKHASPAYYIFIALVLGGITVVEIFALNWAISRILLIAFMVLLGAIKFGLVVAYYTHLKFDNKLYTQLFLFSLGIGLALYTALLFLSAFFGYGG